MARKPFLVALCLLLAMTACATVAETRTVVATFVVVRHAEKDSDDPRDPSLTDAGRQRAAALAGALANDPVVAVYATGFRRTRQTAEPVASMHGLPVIGYDAKQATGVFVAELRRRHAEGVVLVVGHSNTVPGIASALCACTVAEIDDSDYGNRYTVRIDGAGLATMTHTRD